jgi:asparagine synthase (glutamine-hydrolysing)
MYYYQDKALFEYIRNMLTFRYDPYTRKSKRGNNQVGFCYYPEDLERQRTILKDILPFAEKLLRKSIRKQLRKFKTITVSMGSGIDTTILLAIIREELPDVHIIGLTMSFGNSSVTDETDQASKIAEHFGFECRKIHQFNVLEELPLNIAIVAEPRWNTYYYYIAKIASSLGSNAIITGDGADEVFGGYTFRYEKYLKLLDNLNNTTWKAKTWCYMRCHERDWVDDQEKIFGSRIRFDWTDILSIIKPFFDNSLNPLQQVFLADYNGKLIHDFMPTNKKVNHYLGLKGILPFLEDETVSLGLRLPINYKYEHDSGLGKIVLRKMLESRGLLFLVAPYKIAFGPDPLLLWKNYAKEICAKYLETPEIVKQGLISKEWLSIKMNEQCKDVRVANKLITILSLEIWYRIFISKTLSAKTKLSIN